MTDQYAKPPLSEYAQNAYSQHGEDGIIEEMLARIGASFDLDGWCVEFGAWDGIYLSNTYNLIKNKNYNAVLIEGDNNKYNELCENIPSSDIIKIRHFVEFDGDASLDGLLSETPIPRNYDFLSIDIDGCDYYILQSISIYKPKIICIEYNPSIPNEVDFIQKKCFSVKQGASARALTELAIDKDYALVAVTQTNLLFVQHQYKNAVIGDGAMSLNCLRNDESCKQFVFCGFDGTILSNKPSASLNWHRLEVDIKEIQPLPAYLRRFPDDYTLLQKIAFQIFLLIRFPRMFIWRHHKLFSKTNP